MKKAVVLFSCLLLMISSSFAFDFDMRVIPSFDITPMSELSNGINGTLSFDFHPVNIRGRDSFYASLQGSFIYLMPSEIDGIQIYDGTFDAGYNFRLNDRIEFFAEGGVGVWQTPANSKYDYKIAQGLSFNARIGGDYYITPGIQLGASFGYKNFYYKPSPLVDNLQLGLIMKFNLSNGMFSKSSVKVTETTTEAVYPVFFSRYNDNPFGAITFVNNEKNKIEAVEVQVFVEKYMANPKTIGKYDVLAIGEEVSIPLTAFFSDSILENLTSSKADLVVSVSYKNIGVKKTVETVVELQTLSRNSMNWDDDRHAAAFVSGKDTAAYEFSHRVVSVVKKELNPDVPKNMQYAKAIFGALRAYGINYVIDPSSAFTDNVGSSAVDFLQFPYQTILYHGGDCDDLSILNCSLLESIGINAAFITVPGHIYIAYDSGVAVEDAEKVIKDGYYINMYDKIWIPLEITLSQDPYSLAVKTGYKQWVKAGENAALIPLSDAWKEFKPISVPSAVEIEFPENELILKYFHEK